VRLKPFTLAAFCNATRAAAAFSPFSNSITVGLPSSSFSNSSTHLDARPPAWTLLKGTCRWSRPVGQAFFSRYTYFYSMNTQRRIYGNPHPYNRLDDSYEHCRGGDAAKC